ncbi:hypothetical protein [Reyranella soli]|nr:hypothetical protein [Reyranella soli]
MNALSLMAAPTFAVMALVTAIGGGPIDGFCGTSPPLSAHTGMAPMYLLMSVFHAAPWLKLMRNGRPLSNSSPPLGGEVR